MYFCLLVCVAGLCVDSVPPRLPWVAREDCTQSHDACVDIHSHEACVAAHHVAYLRGLSEARDMLPEPRAATVQNEVAQPK